MTERIYEQDAYCREFTATVQACETTKDGFRVVLDKTAFFPEGGGQGADGGYLSDTPVTDVQIQNDIVWHTVATPFAVGDTVSGRIDWETRFARMQSHAGEHIVSAAVHTLFGYDNVGFHMSDALMTVDFNGVLTAEDIETVERFANEAVWKNVPITVSYPTPEQLGTMDYRSKLDLREGVRLVTIQGVDCCACCAPHPAFSGEIGAIKICNHIPYKQGTRIEMLAGVHAFKDYMMLNAANKQLMGLLSAPRDGVVEAVEQQMEVIRTLRAEVQNLSRTAALAGLRPQIADGVAFAVLEGVGYDELRYCANQLTANDADSCVLLSREADGYIYLVYSKTADVGTFVKAFNTAFNGRGGGKKEYAQGKIGAFPADEIGVFVQNNLR